MMYGHEAIQIKKRKKEKKRHFRGEKETEKWKTLHVPHIKRLHFFLNE